jgi:aspartate racemase
VKHIGIVAVSAEGAALCYRTICTEGPAWLATRTHPPVTMHTHPLSEYLRLLRLGRWEDVARLLHSSAGTLVRAGAELLICPDNTLHQALDLVRSDSAVPWLHIAEEVASVASSRRFRCLGILGTRYLMEGPVYGAKLGARGIRHEIPDAETRVMIDGIILEELIEGRFEDRAREYVRSAIQRLGERGCDAVVLGCTELPLLVSENHSPLPALDSTRILASAALREATR